VVSGVVFDGVLGLEHGVGDESVGVFVGGRPEQLIPPRGHSWVVGWSVDSAGVGFGRGRQAAAVSRCLVAGFESTPAGQPREVYSSLCIQSATTLRHRLRSTPADAQVAGLGTGGLHEGDLADPVVGMLKFAGVPKSGLGEERDDAVAEVADHSRTSGDSGAH
jgi:hypothetical protein